MKADTIDYRVVRDQGLTVVGDDVYDLRRMAERHKGGEAPVTSLLGRDATLQVINAHGVQGKLPALPRGLRVGRIDAETVPPLDRELKTLLAELQAEGLFSYRTRWLAFDIVFAVVFAFLGLVGLSGVFGGGGVIAGALALAASQLHVMWWVHDVCHNAVFPTEAEAKRWAEAASILFVGTPVLRYQYLVHRTHHALTNVLGGDRALETGPVVWDERMRGKSPSWFVAVQPLAWFVGLLPLTFFAFLIASAVDAVRRREPGSLLWTAARWLAVLALMGPAATGWVLLATCVAGYALSLLSSLNHFHLPIANRPTDEPFGLQVGRVCQNLRYGGAFATWVFGGLNLHVEHHLFATMPRQSYPRVAGRVRALFARHGVPYHRCGLTRSVANLVGQLSDPFDEGEALNALTESPTLTGGPR